MPKPTRLSSNRRYGNRRRPKSARPMRRRTSSARPMRALKSSYRAQNVYRFVRETIPQTLGFSLIPAGSSFPQMGYLDFDNLQFNQLVQAQAEFGALFARYKVDKIVTVLTPMIQQVVQPGATGISYTAALRITRVNTKWLNEDFEIQADADDQLAELAQLQGKSVSNYASPRSLTLTTVNPGMIQKSIVDSADELVETRVPSKWLNISSEANVPLKHNSLLFAERVDGGALDASWKYRVVHKIYFRCAQVG